MYSSMKIYSCLHAVTNRFVCLATKNLYSTNVERTKQHSYFKISNVYETRLMTFRTRSYGARIFERLVP